jgi:hypothetical protein
MLASTLLGVSLRSLLLDLDEKLAAGVDVLY